ncbi:hypothetical protein [Enterovibrio norvegicus]|uniref:hypothetical protein n=1 Tax=Enterovibrio norvegicus TaxID=188144 RepID=UPI0024B26747|nr:hypothetical protein [Enterovibrio norvegicus]
MQSDDLELETLNAVDDWGDYAPVIAELGQQEQAPLEEPPKEDKTQLQGDSVAGLLDVAFTLVEQVTSSLSGVKFRFDDEGKTAVIDAAKPVFTKNSGELLELFGDYIDEATLIIAVFGLVWGSKAQLAALKQEKREREHVKETDIAEAA